MNKKPGFFSLILVLVLLSSCYSNSYTGDMVTITDRGVTSSSSGADKEHTIEMSMPSSYEFITYTLDGYSEPTAASTKYTAPITVSEGVTVRSAAFRKNSKGEYLRSIIAELKVSGE